MADIPGQAKFIQIEETDYRFVGSESMLQKIGGSMNYIVDALDNFSIGEIVHSMLTLAQFQTIMGPGWILADGSDVTGSRWQTLTGNTTVPDCRGLFVRGRQNNRVDGNGNGDGDLPFGTYQADVMASHKHDVSVIVLNALAIDRPNVSAAGGDKFNVTGVLSSLSVGVAATGGNETRPHCLTVNIFIRIN